MIDLTLDRLKRPAITGLVPNFGTTVEVTEKNKGGLSTTEVDANMALPYELMREVNISTSDETSIVEYDAKLAFVGDKAITLRIQNGSYIGCTIKITNRGTQTSRIEFNDTDALSVGPTQSYILEWTGGNWWLGKEDADILKVTFTVNGDLTNQNTPCLVDVPLETLREYARSGLPINAIVKVQQEGVVVTYTSNSIASSTESTPLGEITQVMMSGWFYNGDKQIFLNISTSSSGDIFLQHREVLDTAIDNTCKYTFVVDSVDAVFQWAHNIKDDGQDYTSVLVKKGLWSTNFEYLDTIGTKVIVGEPGAQLDNGQIPIGYSQLPDSSEYYIQGIKSLSGFKNCTNLTNCTATTFVDCSNLINCSSPANMQVNPDFLYKFYKCSNLLNCMGENIRPYSNFNTAVTSIVFKECNGLVACRGRGIGASIVQSGQLNPTQYSGYAFDDCTGVFHCSASGNSTTKVFNACYASNSKTSTYACADTANGGFNNTTNPSA